MAKTDDFRGGEPMSAADALNALMEKGIGRTASAARSASRAWYQANGDFEHRHTCGVYLRDLSAQGLDSQLIVYIDSNVVMQDFTTNREIYRLRLENQGFVVSDVQFRLSKYKRSGQSTSASAKAETTVAVEFPAATPEDMDQARQATEGLPDGLRQKVYEAMISSKRRQRAKGTD